MNLQWFDLSEVQSSEMPYTAKYILQHYIDVGMHNSQMYSGIADGKQVCMQIDRSEVL